MELFTATNLAALILGAIVGIVIARAIILFRANELRREREAEELDDAADYDRRFREAYRLDAERDERFDA